MKKLYFFLIIALSCVNFAVANDAVQPTYEEASARVHIYFEDSNGHRELSSTSDPESQTNLYFGGWSYHWDRSLNLNETNPMFMVQHEHFVIGIFKNSYSNETFMIGYGTSEYEIWNDLKVGAWGGMSYGYEKWQTGFTLGDTKWMPLVVPYITYTKYALQPVVGLMADEAIFLTMRYNF